MKLSVVICTYNRAHFLSRALASVQAQTDQGFELVVVDDGSTDDTERLVASLAPRFADCKYVKKAHSGIAETRNAAVAAAAGSHVSFLDSDDLWAPSYVADVRAAFARWPEVELVACNGVTIDESGAILGSFFPGPTAAGPWRASSVAEIFAFFPCAGTGTICFSRVLFERTGPFRGYPTAWEDWAWIIRALEAGATCAILPEPLLFNRMRGDNITARIDDELRGWMLSYEDLWGRAADGETRAHGWRFTRPRLVAALARCTPATNRALLEQAMRLFGHRALLTPMLALTYVGLCRVARVGVRGKHLVWPRRPGGRVDLDAPPDELFSAILRALHS